MDLPKILEKVLPHESRPKQMFLSLVITSGEMLGSVWNQTGEGKTDVLATSCERVLDDNWEERIIAADKAITSLEGKVPGVELSKVVLGLPSDYLTETGDVDPKVKPEIKKLTTELSLDPIGFVSVHQALIHKLKVDEGVPPSVILINVKKDGLTIHLYKIGNLLGTQTIGREEIVSHVEEVLKSFTELEVLPSRMLLYGSDADNLEEVKRLLLKYPWPTKANFLHFPKIEILPEDTSVLAVSLAGASEMRGSVNLEEKIEGVPSEKVVAQPDVSREASAESELKEKANEGFEETEPSVGEVNEESNVEMVAPESLGFKKSEDVLEKTPSSLKSSIAENEEEDLSGEEEKRPKFHFSLPAKIPTFDFSKVTLALNSLPLKGGKLPIIGGGVAFILVLLFAVYWLLPHARVTVLELTKSVDETATFTIDPTATVADSSSKIVPGLKQEQSVTGDKTIPATGQKQVGDPAKGAVTIYNKDTSGSKTFPKGSILAAGSLKFTLNSDVTVASASQTIDTITFGKAGANITAAAIGTASNLPAGTAFDFQDFATSIAVARNDQPLTGGTSKTVTVVSRDDYDNLVKSLTRDLIAKAKSDLASSVSGQTRLIDDTVEASVTQKNFSQEIDQQAKELSGNLTVTVSGLAYNEEDVLTFMKGLVGNKLPKGYSFPSSGEIKITKTTIKKDGSVLASVKFHAEASPTFDVAGIQKNLAGKSLQAAQEYLKSITGVAGADFDFSWNIFGKRMPANSKNISVSVGMQ